MDRVRAHVFSLGGGILLSLLGVLFVMLWIGTHLPNRHSWLEGLLTVFTGIMALYALDGASESLTVQNDELVFDGWLTRRRRVSLRGVSGIVLTHEGLNTEWGIETLTFQHADGHEEHLPLGPLWRQRDLEGLLTRLKTSTT